MIVLAIDTCLGACSAGISHDGRVLASCSEPMSRGHQERLAPMVREVMTEAAAAFSDLDRVAATVGPGSFTGLRVGLAFAKGLSLALGMPCVGVGTLEALAETAGGGLVAAAIDAGRGNVFLQVFDGRRSLTEPETLPIGTAEARLGELFGERSFRITGPGAALLGIAGPGHHAIECAWPTPEAVLSLGARAPLVAARPLYLRPADAKPKAKRESPAWT